MAENNAFAQALHNFTMDVAAGDAIRYMTDKGYTPAEISETLSFPTPMDYIEKIMWDRLVETRKILSDSPCTEQYEITEHHDRYGRKSFLQVKKESPEEMIFSPEDYVQYENVWVLKHALKQVSSLSDHILPKVRSTGSHRDT